MIGPWELLILGLFLVLLILGGIWLVQRLKLNWLQIIGLVGLTTLLILVVGPWLFNQFSERIFTLDGEWNVTIYNPAFNLIVAARLQLTQIKDEIWGSMVTEQTEYSVKGRREVKDFVLELTNTIYPDRKMTFRGNILDANNIGGEYSATTGLGLFGVNILQVPTQGQWRACKMPC